jgi:hypothetical protein
MTPLERESCRAAQEADRECRRFEEKQWAQVQGKKVHAAQMAWQVKGYSAFMQSFYH